MQFIGLMIVLIGLYLVDSGIRDRAPIGFLKAIIDDPSDLSGTLDEYNGQWTGDFVNYDGPTGAEGRAEGQANGAANSGLIATMKAKGYKNGRLPSSALTTAAGQTVTLHKISTHIAPSYQRLNAAYKERFGHNIRITDGYRSYAGQVAAKAAKGYLAATPGTSNHGWGLALDLGGGINQFGTAEHQWMTENAPSFGFAQPAWARQGGAKPEPWHWEYAGYGQADKGEGRGEKSREGTF